MSGPFLYTVLRFTLGRTERYLPTGAARQPAGQKAAEAPLQQSPCCWDSVLRG